MKDHNIVNRYADAFFLNINHEKYLKVSENLKLTIDILSDEVIGFFSSTTFTVQKKLDFLEKVFEKYPVLEEVKNLLIVLINRKRIYLLKDIYFLYQKKMNKAYNKAYVIVETQYSLNEDLKSNIKNNLEKKFQQEIVITEVINKNLIAGILVKKDDLVIDLSISGRLKNMKSLLKSKVNN
jgi:F-type H+-transporting ATPase subunit delta